MYRAHIKYIESHCLSIVFYSDIGPRVNDVILVIEGPYTLYIEDILFT